MSSTLIVRGLQKSYGARQVVSDVSLHVESGEVVGLLGPNGAGKTTSFYMIVGLIRPDGGEITIEGRRVERMPIHQRSRLGLSYLPQEPSIFRRLNVKENIRAVLELQVDSGGRPLKKPVIDEMLDKLLRDLSIEKLRASPAPALSGGERLEAGRGLLLGLEERVLLEHLLDFLVQLERRQLQQPDRLLQLRRQREMLREADLERLLHVRSTS